MYNHACQVPLVNGHRKACPRRRRLPGALPGLTILEWRPTRILNTYIMCRYIERKANVLPKTINLFAKNDVLLTRAPTTLPETVLDSNSY